MSSERSASTFRRATATPAEQRMMELLSAAKIPYYWQFPIERFGEYTSAGNLKTYWLDFLVYGSIRIGIKSAFNDMILEIDGGRHQFPFRYDKKQPKVNQWSDHTSPEERARMPYGLSQAILEAVEA